MDSANMMITKKENLRNFMSIALKKKSTMITITSINKNYCCSYQEISISQNTL
jgi:hypothetical protein